MNLERPADLERTRAGRSLSFPAELALSEIFILALSRSTARSRIGSDPRLIVALDRSRTRAIASLRLTSGAVCGDRAIR